MVLKYNQYHESLIRDNSLKQLKRIAKLSAKTDIGNRINDDEKKSGNLISMGNSLNKHVDTYEEYMKKGK